MLWLSACDGDSGLKVFTEAPSVNITKPTAGEEFYEYEAVLFTAEVDDNQTRSTNFRWCGRPKE